MVSPAFFPGHWSISVCHQTPVDGLVAVVTASAIPLYNSFLALYNSLKYQHSYLLITIGLGHNHLAFLWRIVFVDR
jgi:hypothetical protein